MVIPLVAGGLPAVGFALTTEYLAGILR
jgi:hypothetical protein